MLEKLGFDGVVYVPEYSTVEFDHWLHTNKVIYGRPDNAQKSKYLDWLYELDYNKKPITDLNELVIATIEMTNQLYEEINKCKTKKY